MLNVLIAGVSFGLAYIAGSIMSTEVRKKENKQKRGKNMVGFVFWIGMSFVLLVLAFVSARFAFKSMKSKDYNTMSFWLIMVGLAVMCGISAPVIAMNDIPISSASETVSDIKVFSKKDATCIIVYDGDIIENFDTKIIPITDDSENYTMIIDRDYSKIRKVIAEKYTLLVPKEIPSLEQRREDCKND